MNVSKLLSWDIEVWAAKLWQFEYIQQIETVEFNEFITKKNWEIALVVQKALKKTKKNFYLANSLVNFLS